MAKKDRGSFKELADGIMRGPKVEDKGKEKAELLKQLDAIITVGLVESRGTYQVAMECGGLIQEWMEKQLKKEAK